MRRLLLASALLAPVPTLAQAPAKDPAPAAEKKSVATPPLPAKGAAPKGKTPGSKSVAKLPAIETFTLPNGLQVAVLPIDAAPVVSVQVWYHAGSKDEARDRRGSAHMFEHMLFKGTGRVRSESHAQFLNGVGGYVNAETDEDATHYVNTVPAAYLDFALQLEADRMRNLLFRKEMVDSEREVVKEEIRQQENSPIRRGYLKFLEVAFSKHPYAWTAGGTIADLDRTTVDDLKKFYADYYQPSNAMVVVVGKTTAAAVKASAEKWFGAIPKAGDPPRPAAISQEPPQTAQRKETADPSQIGLTLVGWHLPPSRDKDSAALQVAALVLGGGESSRLKVRLKGDKDKKGIALDGGVQSLVREDPGLTIAIGVYLDAAQSGPVEAAILDEVTRLGTKGPAADELKKAKSQVQTAFVFSLEDAQGMATAIGRSWIHRGDPTAFLAEVDAIDKVTAADVQRVVKQYMTPELATIVAIPPKGR